MADGIPHYWQLPELLDHFPELRQRPVLGRVALKLAGTLAFRAGNAVGGDVNEQFSLTIHVPRRFPQVLPTVWEVGGRIPSSFHRNPGDGSLCLGSPLQLFVRLKPQRTLLGFVNRCLIPYLYNFVIGQQRGTLPFGELRHGTAGLLDDYKRLLRTNGRTDTIVMLRMLGKKKRIANKHPCPCGSGHRVGRCHHRVLNRLRKVQSRSWFLAQSSVL